MNNIEPLTEVCIGNLTVKVFREPEISEKDARSILNHFMEKLSNGQVVNKKGEPVKNQSMDFMIIQKDHTLCCGRKSDDHSDRLVGVVLKNIKVEEVNQPAPIVGNYGKSQLKTPVKFAINEFKLTE